MTLTRFVLDGKLLASSVVLLALVCQCNTSPASKPGSAGGVAPNTKDWAHYAHGWFNESSNSPAQYPARISLGPDDVVYATDPANNRVVGTRDDQVLLTLEGIDRPRGMDVLGDRLYVGSERRGSVEAYDLKERRFLFALGAGEGEFETPNAIAIARDGSVYVADSRADVVKVFDADGALRQVIGGRGTANGEFRFPAAIAVDAGRLVVGDQGNHRVQIFDLDGDFLRKFGRAVPESVDSRSGYRGAFTRIQGIALLGDRIAVLDSYHGHVQVFDEAGESVLFIGRRGECKDCVALALDVTADGAGGVLVSDPERRRVVSWVLANSADTVLP